MLKLIDAEDVYTFIHCISVTSLTSPSHNTTMIFKPNRVYCDQPVGSINAPQRRLSASNYHTVWLLLLYKILMKGVEERNETRCRYYYHIVSVNYFVRKAKVMV